jgi:serine/threonine protein kinase
MEPSELEQLKEIFYAAIQESPDQRAEFLARACGSDENLLAEVTRLLAEHDTADGFLESPFSSVSSLRYLASGDKNLEINRLIAGRYRVVSFLGEGGMGVVYKAEDTRLPRFVALKSLGRALAGDAMSLERLRREAQAASSLNHPNICTIHDVVESEGHTFIVMEYLEGQTLKEMIRSGCCSTEETQPQRNEVPFPLDNLIGIATQIIEGLEAAHDKGIVHRDIKPANVFVTKAGLVKILDFGIAKMARPFDSDAALAGHAQSGLHFEEYLTTGVAAGTIGYMSPEQVNAQQLDARTDLFSFGAVLYEMTTGAMPFAGQSTKLVLDSILSQEIVPAERLNPNIPPELEEVIGKCLQKDRDLRYQKALDVRVDLQRLKQVLNLAGSAKAPFRGKANRNRVPLRVGGVKAIGFTAAITITLVLAGYISSVRLLAFPDQPRVGRLDGSSLVILDGKGRGLWKKFFPEGFGPDYYYNEKLSWVGGTHLWFADLEGKGHTSVLFSYSPKTAGLEAHSSTLICYSDLGKEKWRWSPGRDLPELNGSPATYVTHSLGILKATETRPLRIVVASQQVPWWPTQIALLDSNGKTTSEYWHSGGVLSMTVADLYGDGKEEIIAAGIANGYDHQATLVVLDPDRMFGASKEVRPEFQIHGMGDAQERLRLLFPRSDLNRALYQYNQALDPTVEHGVLRVKVAECINALTGCQIWYEFDKNIHLIAAYAGSDEFRSAHNKFFQTGKNAHTLSAEEQAAFLKVRCLAGCKTEFVPVGKLVP